MCFKLAVIAGMLTSVSLAATAGLHAQPGHDHSPKPGAGKIAPGHEGHDHAKENDLVSFLEHHEEYSTLVGLIRQADLIDTLEGEGPFTLFAPTNDAFAKVDEETLNQLTRPESKNQLKALLLSHIVPGKVLAADLKDGAQLQTLAQTPLLIRKHGDRLHIGNAELHETDLEVDNGVIHAIEAVLMSAK